MKEPKLQAAMIFGEFTQGNKPVYVEVLPLGSKGFDEFLEQRLSLYLDKENIPEHSVCSFALAVDDLARIERGKDRYYYESIAGKSASDYKMMVLAYCKDNGIDKNGVSVGPFMQYINGQYGFYSAVNSQGLRQQYAGFTDQQKDKLLRDVNDWNPTLDMNYLPAIGNAPVYAPDWAKEKWGNSKGLFDPVKKHEPDTDKPKFKQKH